MKSMFRDVFWEKRSKLLIQRVSFYKHSMTPASGFTFPSIVFEYHRPTFYFGRCCYRTGLHPLSVCDDWCDV